MVNTTVDGYLQIKSAGDERALALKQFGGEILRVYMNETTALRLHRTQSISGAKSYQYPVLGRSSAKRYVEGQNLLDPANGYVSKVQKHERIIHLDRPIVAGPHIIGEFDERISHLDFRAPLADQLGRELSEIADVNMYATMISGARVADGNAALVSGEFGGFRIDSAFSTAAEIIDTFKQARVRFDETNVPRSMRFAVLRPDDYMKLVSSAPQAMNKDYNSPNGDLAGGELPRLFDFQIMWTNNLPSTNLSTTVDPGAYNTTLYPDARETKALFVHYDSIRTLVGGGISVQSEKDFDYNDAWKVKAKMMHGHGVLKFSGLVEVYDSSIVP